MALPPTIDLEWIPQNGMLEDNGRVPQQRNIAKVHVKTVVP